MEKKLYRDMDHKMLCGVCAGIADYFKLDPTIVRVLWAVLTCFAGIGLILYIVCALIIPQKPANYKEN